MDKMIGRLTAGLWINDRDCDLFGIQHGQLRELRIVAFPGWYNIDGELVGAGDLSGQDFLNISRALEPNEVFLVLPHPNDGRVWTNQSKLSIEELASRCCAVITRKETVVIHDFDKNLIVSYPRDFRPKRKLRGFLRWLIEELH